jgi:hypothetical protein
MRIAMVHGRLFVDSSGIEWEVYDESQWTVSWALDWDYLPQEIPGLIFDSSLGRRRIFPCPHEWKKLTDLQLETLLQRAVPLV